jgi:hypothetical protein
MPANFDKPEPETVARLRHIMMLMRRLKWRTGETGVELAKQWGVSEQRVGEIAAEASKRVRAELMNHEHVGATVGSALDWALQEAVDKGDFRAIASLAKVYADAAGASAPQKVELAGKVEATPSRAKEVMRELFTNNVTRSHGDQSGDDEDTDTTAG